MNIMVQIILVACAIIATGLLNTFVRDYSYRGRYEATRDQAAGLQNRINHMLEERITQKDQVIKLQGDNKAMQDLNKHHIKLIERMNQKIKDLQVKNLESKEEEGVS